MSLKIPYLTDLNALEIAVWAAEFVRARAKVSLPPHAAEIDQAIASANAALDDFRRARDHR